MDERDGGARFVAEVAPELDHDGHRPQQAREVFVHLLGRDREHDRAVAEAQALAQPASNEIVGPTDATSFCAIASALPSEELDEQRGRHPIERLNAEPRSASAAWMATKRRCTVFAPANESLVGLTANSYRRSTTGDSARANRRNARFGISTNEGGNDGSGFGERMSWMKFCQYGFPRS